MVCTFGIKKILIFKGLREKGSFSYNTSYIKSISQRTAAHKEQAFYGRTIRRLPNMGKRI